jgi:hypothetical protein
MVGGGVAQVGGKAVLLFSALLFATPIQVIDIQNKSCIFVSKMGVAKIFICLSGKLRTGLEVLVFR